MKENKKILHEGNIDLVQLFKVIWSRKWFIAKVAVVFIFLGLLIAFTSPKEYNSSCILIPETIESDGRLGGSLGGLASIAGLDLNGLTQGGSTINPGLYRNVAQSTPFLLELMNQKFKFEDIENEISLFSYYMEFYKTPLISKLLSIPGTLIGLIKSSSEEEILAELNDSLVLLSKDEQSIVDDLRERIAVTMDWDLNIVSIEIKMQDPRVVAKMTEFTRIYITNYVTEYSINKSQEQLKFVESQLLQRKLEFEQAQLRLATFRDQNTNMNSARALSEEERLKSEYNLTFNIYNQLAQKCEAIKLQVNENIPVFTILEPAFVPVEESSPRKLIILITSVMISLIVSLAIIWISLTFE
jgi:uncharacterized protein involved in exopolysaccharide biosynthesis